MRIKSKHIVVLLSAINLICALIGRLYPSNFSGLADVYEVFLVLHFITKAFAFINTLIIATMLYNRTWKSKWLLLLLIFNIIFFFFGGYFVAFPIMLI